MRKINGSATLYFIFLVFIVACTKSTDDPYPINRAGSLNCSLRLYDRFGHETFVYNDIRIELTDVNKKLIISPDSSGRFRADNLAYGDVQLFVDKPGYGYINTMKVNHNKDTDTLTRIVLVEEIPFPYISFWFDYVDGWVKHRQMINFTTDEHYLVGHIFCFGKNPEVSINKNGFTAEPGSFTDVSYINRTLYSSYTYPATQFLNKGFNYGDTIYVVNYPVSQKFSDTYSKQKNDFEITSYKMNNKSNVTKFILR